MHQDTKSARLIAVYKRTLTRCVRNRLQAATIASCRQPWWQLVTCRRYQTCWDNLSETCLFLSDEGPMLETLDYTIRIGSTHWPFYISICNKSDEVVNLCYKMLTTCSRSVKQNKQCKRIVISAWWTDLLGQLVTSPMKLSTLLYKMLTTCSRVVKQLGTKQCERIY